MPADLPRLPPSRRRPPAEADSATFAALIGLLVLAFGFLGLVSLVLPQVRGMILVLLGGAGFFGVHYLLWGRLLSSIRAEELEAEQGRAASLPPRAADPPGPAGAEFTPPVDR